MVEGPYPNTPGLPGGYMLCQFNTSKRMIPVTFEEQPFLSLGTQCPMNAFYGNRAGSYPCMKPRDHFGPHRYSFQGREKEETMKISYRIEWLGFTREVKSGTDLDNVLLAMQEDGLNLLKIKVSVSVSGNAQERNRDIDLQEEG